MKPATVLIVDDSPVFRHIAGSFLREYGGAALAVTTAESGEEALSLLSTFRPDLVLVDLKMSGMSGLELMPRLRETLPGVPIITITLLDTASHRRAAMAAGADAFVSKATMMSDLIPAIEAAAHARCERRGTGIQSNS